MANHRGSGRTRVSEWTYRLLLHMYPRSFRDAYGSHMVQLFRDLLRDERRRRGAPGVIILWFRVLVDLLSTVVHERQRAMRLSRAMILQVVAVVLGLGIAWVDSRPTWDDTGVSAAAILVVAALLGGLRPARVWWWMFAIGGWIPLYAIIIHHTYASLLALAVACIGAHVGAYARHLLIQMDRAA